MEIRGDLQLKYSSWEKARALTNFDNFATIGLFDRLIDLFIVACAIGILYDEWKSNDLEKEVQTINRNTYGSIQNEDVYRILNFMFKNAILTTKKVPFDNETRLKIAFDSSYTEEKFSPTNFLVEFANYGIDIILEECTNHDIETISKLKERLAGMVNPDYEKILNDISKEMDEMEFKKMIEKSK